MRKNAFLTIILTIMLIITGLGTSNIYASSPAPPELKAEAAILIDQATGKILYAKNPDKQLFPASTTKILTALVAMEYGNLDEIVTIGNEALMVLRGSSIAGFTVGDQISLRELIWALMLPSGNDAAYTIAVHLGRQWQGDPGLNASAALEVFADMMNQHAQKLGANGTNFTVPDGFHHPEHYTTANDLALMAQALMQDAFLREVVGTSRYVPETWVGRNVRPWGNTNQLVRSATENYYEYATGLKTGYTGQAGFTMVSSASNGEMDLIAVILNTDRDGRWNDSIRLLEYGLGNFTWQQLLEDNQVIQTVNISNQDRKQPDTMAIIAVQGFAEIFPLDITPKVEKTIILYEEVLDVKGKRSGAKAASTPLEQLTIKAPIAKGQVVGQLILTLDGEEIFRTDLAAGQDVQAMPWWRRIILPTGFILGLGLPGMVIMKVRKGGKRRKLRYVVAGNRFSH